MENQNSLSAYMISEKTPIFLENTQMGQKLPSEAADNLEFQTTLDVSLNALWLDWQEAKQLTRVL